MTLIPQTFHFLFVRGDNNARWRDIHTLCLRSCLKTAGAQRVVVHYDREDTGALWEEARALGVVEWRSGVAEPPADYRLRVLWEEGGWFCDLDTVFLKSLDIFRDESAVIGTLCKQKCRLSVGMLGACPGAPYIQALRSHAESPTREWDLSQRYPVRVVPRTTFYPVATSNRSFWNGGHVSFRNAHTIRLWADLKPSLTVEDLKKTVLAPMVEAALKEGPHGIAQRLPGVTIVWG